MTAETPGASLPTAQAYVVTVVETYRIEAETAAEAEAEVRELRSGRNYADAVDYQVGTA